MQQTNERTTPGNLLATLKPNDQTPLLAPQPILKAKNTPKAPSHLSLLAKQLKRSELRLGKYSINAVCDWPWVYWSYMLYDIFQQPTDDASFTHEGQWFGQQMYSTAVTFTFVFFLYICYRATQASMPVEFWIYATAASTSILSFDAAFVGAMLLGEDILGLSMKMTSYLIAPFAVGFAASATQNFIIALGTRFKKEGVQEFKSHPTKVMKEIAQEVGFVGLTIGTAPGIVWQLVFNAGYYAKLGPEVTATLVSIAVGATNAVSDQIGDKMLACVGRNNTTKYAELIESRRDSPIQSKHASTNAGAVEHQPTTPNSAA